MKKELFEELVGSIRQAGKIRRGESAPSREFSFRVRGVRAIREQLARSQSEFARTIGVIVATLRNWAQDRREPQGPARALLVVASKVPEVIQKALARTTGHEA